MEQLKDKLHYDPNTGVFTWVNCNKHHSEKTGRLAGTVGTSKGKAYASIGYNGNVYRSHRLAWFLTHGYFPEMIDHINGNSLDNRLCNLRECTSSQNNQNHQGHKKTTSFPPGVRRTVSNKFEARIRVNNKAIQLGTFVTEKEAAEAYLTARRELHDAPVLR